MATYPRLFVQDNGDGTFSLVEEYTAGGFTVRGTGSRTEMEQRYNSLMATGAYGAMGAGGGGYQLPKGTTQTYTTREGPKTEQQIRQELANAGYGGGAWTEDIATLINVYNNVTAGGGGGGGQRAGEGWPVSDAQYAQVVQQLKDAGYQFTGNETRNEIVQKFLDTAADNNPLKQEITKGAGGGGTYTYTGTTGELATPTYGTTPDINKWFEQRPQSYLTYLMQQQGIEPGSMMGQYISEQYDPANLQYLLSTALSAAGKGKLYSQSQFIPEYAAGNIGRMGLSDLSTVAAAAKSNAAVADVLNNMGINAQLRAALEALTGGSSGPYLQYMARTAAEPLYRQWEAAGPSGGTAAQQNFLQYVLSLFGR